MTGITKLALAVSIAAMAIVAASCREPAEPTAKDDLPCCGGDHAKVAEEGRESAAVAEVRRLDRPVLYEGDDPEWVAPGSKASMRRALEHLRQTQNADGGWSPPAGGESNLGISAVAVTGLAAAGVPTDDEMMAKALAFITSPNFVRADGGIHDGTSMNYTTSLVVMALTEVDAVKYEALIRRAGESIGRTQWSGDPESADYGGAGYGGKNNRPDMSNTSFAVQARRVMEEAGIEIDDDFMSRAVVFVSRNQSGEAARGFWVGANDGGFIYTTHAGGESKAGEFILPGGGRGLKSYGSITYAGFLSLIYAGLDRQDQRVQAALEWIGRHWTLEENPEMGLQGYFYYLMYMGKGLHAYGEPMLVDDKGVGHPWRKILSAKLIELQGEDGSWINAADRWFESARPVVTGYGLIAMSSAIREMASDR
jgi:squalene-hopene/tetraprenyl-beta-curcumene cyclase